MKRREVIELFIRYSLLIVLGSFNLLLFYLIFTPLTVYPSFLMLNYLFDAQLINPTLIFIKGFYAQIIPACIAGAAYYFLLILNMTTPMKIKQRIGSIIFMFALFLFLNVIRITVFASLISENFQYFNQAHSITWYFGSTLLVILIWFINVKAFNIENIPVYTDMNNLFTDIINKH